MTRKRLFDPPNREDYVHRVDAEQQLPSSIKKFKADLIGGNLVILHGENNECHYKLQWKENTKPELLPKLTVADGEVLLKSKSFKPFIKQKDAYVIELTLPRQTDIEINMFAGTIFIDNIDGQLKINLNLGDVQAISHTHDAEISVWAGNIYLYQPQKNVDAKVKLGDVKVLFAETPPQDARIKLASWLGDVTARFPHGFLLDNDKIKGNLLDKNSTGVKIEASVKLGDVTIDQEEKIPA